jgi:transmembrane sensor
MGDPRELEAADWHARLRTRSVANSDLAEFARWRRLPGNADAYSRVEAMWRAAGDLAGDADVGSALDRALDRRARPSHRTVGLAAGGLTAAIVAAALFVAGYLGSADQRYRTVVGERSQATLEDGTRLLVDAASDLEVRMVPTARLVRLSRGQALFSVRHDAHRPFTVSTPSGVEVTALGTRFDVEARSDRRVAVALIEGSVAVSSKGRTLVTLTPGEALLVEPSGEFVINRNAASDAVDWTRGRLIFRGTRLADAVSEMNRYATPAIQLTTDAAAGEELSGEFSTDDPEGFVRAVNSLIGPGTVARSRVVGG